MKQLILFGLVVLLSISIGLSGIDNETIILNSTIINQTEILNETAKNETPILNETSTNGTTIKEIYKEPEANATILNGISIEITLVEIAKIINIYKEKNEEFNELITKEEMKHERGGYLLVQNHYPIKIIREGKEYITFIKKEEVDKYAEPTEKDLEDTTLIVGGSK